MQVAQLVAPTVRHMRAVERALRYLGGTRDIGLVIGSCGSQAAGSGSEQQVEAVCA